MENKKNFEWLTLEICNEYKERADEYSGAAKPPVRKDGNRLSGQVETANASLLA